MVAMLEAFYDSFPEKERTVCMLQIHSWQGTCNLRNLSYYFPNIDTHFLNSAASDFVFLMYGPYTLHEATRNP